MHPEYVSLNTQSTSGLEEDSRRRQLIEVTIDSLAELGFVGTTLAQIAARASVSPGLVAHYFGDKDGLLDAAFRALVRRIGDQVRLRLTQAHTPRARIQAIIDANLAPAEFDRRTGTAWLAFWGQVPHLPGLKRIQSVYQRRTLSNLRGSLQKLLPRERAASLAAMIAAMIDGVWLRAALSGWGEADSEGARGLLSEFVDGRLGGSPERDSVSPAAGSPADVGSPAGVAVAAFGTVAASARDATRAVNRRFASLNPATGEILGYVRPCAARSKGRHAGRRRAPPNAPGCCGGRLRCCAPATMNSRCSRHAIPASPCRRRGSST
jgi:betaine-aldehyde dehydrogenase